MSKVRDSVEDIREIDSKLTAASVDGTATEGSTNPISSDAVYKAVQSSSDTGSSKAFFLGGS